MIHPTAVVDASAELGSGVEIGPFALVGAGVVIGDDCRIAAHAVLRTGTRLGRAVVIDSFAVLGGAPQSRAAPVTTGYVRIGDRTIVREGVTINLPTHEGGATTVGRDCMLMANSHVGHDSTVGDHVVLANCVLLAGHVEVADRVFFGGASAVHQFVRIGRGAMIGGNATISYDVPPYTIAAERNSIHGLNLVGIRRQGIPPADVADLKRCYHAVYRDTGNLRERAALAIADPATGTSAPGQTFLEFFATGRRGFAQCRPRREPSNS